MSNEKNELGKSSECESSSSFITTFSDIIVDGLFELENNNYKSASFLQAGLPRASTFESDANLISTCGDETLKQKTSDYEREQNRLEHQRENTYLQLQSASSSSFPAYSFNSPPAAYSSLEGASLESGSSSVSFVTEIEIIPLSTHPIPRSGNDDEAHFWTIYNESNSLTMESSQDQSLSPSALVADLDVEAEVGASGGETSDKGTGSVQVVDTGTGNDDGSDASSSKPKDSYERKQEDVGTTTSEITEEDFFAGNGGLGGDEEEDEDDDTTTLSSEAVVDDIELILMPEMCHDLSSINMSPKLVRVTELKVNIDDVFCDDDEDNDQSSRHEFRSIVDEVCEDDPDEMRYGGDTRQLSFGDDDVSSGSELIGSKQGASGAYGGESSKSSSSSRRRRSISGRISSGVQTDITAVDEPSALTSQTGYRRKSSGKSSGRLGLPSGSGKKLNWKSELTLLPSKMKVKQAGFNSFECNDERDQYSHRVAKFTSQDTLNLSSQFLKPSTLYRTRNLSRNLNQFASSESTFMLPMSSEQQLSAESPRFRDRVSSSTSGGNFKGTTTSHSYSAYQISSILSGSGGGGGVSGGIGYGMGCGGGNLSSARRQPLISGYSTGNMTMSSSRNFRSSMPDLNAVNKSFATIADSHRRRPPSKSIKHHHSSSGFRLQKRSSSDDETSSLIDESERCLRSSIDLLLTDELPSPGGDSCFRSTGFGSSSLAANTTGFYSSRRTCSQPILNDQAYPPEMRDSSMGSPFLPRKLSDMRCSRWAKVILPNGHVAIVSVKETDEIQDSLTVYTDTGCVITLPFRKVVFAWRTKR